MGITTSDLHETARLSEIQKESRLLSSFLDWLAEQEYAICELKHFAFSEEAWQPRAKDNESLLADYFKIDLNEVENNRKELLRRIRISTSRRAHKHDPECRCRRKLGGTKSSLASGN